MIMPVRVFEEGAREQLDDGLTLTVKDIGGAWELAYRKEAA